MSKKNIIFILILAIALVGGFLYRFTHLKTGGGHAGEKEADHQEATAHPEEAHGEEETGHVEMSLEMQKEHGVVVAAAAKQTLAGELKATGKVAVNADRIAHVSPHIPGRIVAVRAFLGDSVGAGQALATLDSIELNEALSRYQQTKTRLQLAKNTLDRALALSEKKILARKEVFQAESDYQIAQAEFRNDEDRLALYGLSAAELESGKAKRPLLAVRAPIGGVITEKQAVVGEFADPAKSLYTVADLATVWIMVDINEKDLAKVRRGQTARVTVGAFPDLPLEGRLTHIADLVNEATRTVSARVEVANPRRLLKPEMFATVSLTLPADAPPVLAVPEEAVHEVAGKKVLFVTANNREFTPRAITLGRTGGGLVEVISGLQEGERFAAKGSFLLKSEMQKGELGEHGH